MNILKHRPESGGGLSILLASVIFAAGHGMSTRAALAPSNFNGGDSESFTADYGSASSPSDGDDRLALRLPEFNPALGILTGVTLELFSNDFLESEVVNLTSKRQDYSGAYAAMGVRLTTLDGLSTTTYAKIGPFSGETGSHKLGKTVAGEAQVDVSSHVIVNPDDFSLFEGAGKDFKLNVQVSDGMFGGNRSCGDLAFFGKADSWGYVEVVYDYSAIPEPGTLAAGLVLLGFCFFSSVRFLPGPPQRFAFRRR